MEFRTINQLKEYLEKQLVNAIESEEVKDVIYERMRYFAKKNVYDVYEPKQYNRREEIGGLIDPSLLESAGSRRFDGGIMVMFYNMSLMASDENSFLTPIIEDGVENPTQIYQFPRPFIQPTIDSFKETGELTEIVKQQLRSVGINCL